MLQAVEIDRRASATLVAATEKRTDFELIRSRSTKRASVARRGAVS